MPLTPVTRVRTSLGSPRKTRKGEQFLLSLSCRGTSPKGEVPWAGASRPPLRAARGLARSADFAGPPAAGNHVAIRPIPRRALRLRPSQSQGRQSLHRLHGRLAKPRGRPLSWQSPGHPRPLSTSPDLLRGLPAAERRQSPRSLPQERLRKALHPETNEPLLLSLKDRRLVQMRFSRRWKTSPSRRLRSLRPCRGVPWPFRSSPEIPDPDRDIARSHHAQITSAKKRRILRKKTSPSASSRKDASCAGS